MNTHRYGIDFLLRCFFISKQNAKYRQQHTSVVESP